MTNRTRTLAAAVMSLRVVYGVALIAAPDRLSRRWLGPDGERAPTQVALRGLGAREIIVHGAGLAVALRGGSLRGFVVASVAGDLADVAATVAGRDGLPAGAAPATIAVAGGSALLTAVVGVLAERH
jgi:hypothetical protein